MAGLTTAGRPPLRAEDRERLRSRAVEAVRRARRRGEALAALTVPLPARADPPAIAAASRRPGEPWFTYEQSDRDGFALAALGCVAALDGGGAERFARVAARWGALGEHAAGDLADGRRGALARAGRARGVRRSGRPARQRPGRRGGLRVRRRRLRRTALGGLRAGLAARARGGARAARPGGPPHPRRARPARRRPRRPRRSAGGGGGRAARP